MGPEIGDSEGKLSGRVDHVQRVDDPVVMAAVVRGRRRNEATGCLAWAGGIDVLQLKAASDYLWIADEVACIGEAEQRV
jgi:hypothetical protein